jgi:hypothetical protein
MGMALDEPHDDDEKIEVEGVPFIISKDVKDTIKDYGNLMIEYMDSPEYGKGFHVSFEQGSCGGSCC